MSRFKSDADLMFDWDDVVEVELALASGAQMQCPISLDSPPICPQITVGAAVRPHLDPPYLFPLRSLVRDSSHRPSLHSGV